MKKITVLAAVAALATATPAMGAELSDSEAKVCSLTGFSAKAIMAGRQAGISPSKVYETLEPMMQEKLPAMLDLVIIMIREAYARPSFFGTREQTKAISDYQVEKELSCFKHFTSN